METAEVVRSQSVVNYLSALCERNEISCTLKADKYGLLPKILLITLPPEVPKEESKVMVEEEIVQYCFDNQLPCEIFSNTNGSKIVPTKIKVSIGKGCALDETEREIIREHVDNNWPFQFYKIGGYHHFNFDEFVDTFKYDVIRSMYPSGFVGAGAGGIPTVVEHRFVEPPSLDKPTDGFWKRLGKHIPFVKQRIAKKERELRRQDMFKAWEEVGLSDKLVQWAGIRWWEIE